MLNKRFLSAVIGTFCVFLILRAGGILLLITVGFLIRFGLDEFFQFAEAKGAKPNKTWGLIGSLVLLLVVYLKSNNFVLPISTSSVVIVFLYLLLLKNLFISSKEGTSAIFDSATTILGVLYIGGFFSYFILIYNFTFSGEQLGEILIWIPIISSWMTDTFAYLVGMKFGKHSLAPQVSPNKTIEGAVGGVVGSVIGVLVYGSLLPLTIKERVILGVILSVASQLGDLVESSLKRDAEIKDSGDLIPGHGGLLDRFDSLLFALPTFYYLLIFLG
ncbi:phosphatidate cytidylyltransferase [Fuchsiella alkaliacetigena]|uniref:phosphatidate cytidylyltransferase n=1 Tax=Fuchsiella alkaliacetigena TaxID=957042 RepID=UPI00200A1EC4|nr:phosphatidate cytidylyltransferase [Fuchsiella alkaliacetigena]MCK8823516.1 phosphatidate cytidylyltransferase [Fuchsiella alkaliacetigena]